ncbi:MAG TPA: response regulator [Ktedonobacteraceae bacterium]|nr:response regulator [Ktedonobacteraceae bacterium]
MARIGLLEDNYRISKLCATMLNYAGHEVTIYVEAFECLYALSILDSPFEPLPASTANVHTLPIDVLILDLHLPTIPGIEVLRLLRNTPHTCDLPLIFCTAATPSEVRAAFTIAPDAALVEKPFKLQALMSAIAEVLPEPMEQR